MDISVLNQFLLNVLAMLAALFVFAVGLGVLALAALYVVDVSQTRHAIRRNYPVIGRLRYLLEHLGAVLPAVLLRHGPGGDAVQPSATRPGSIAPPRTSTTPSRSARRATCARPGTILFANAPFPSARRSGLPAQRTHHRRRLSAAVYAAQPLQHLGDELGAISKPAVLACRTARAWLAAG